VFTLNFKKRGLWDKKTEILFFKDAANFATSEQLFYSTDDGRLLAYWPKKYEGKKTTIQARNALIGNYTEKWTTDLVQHAVEDKGLYAIQGAVCDEIGLPKSSPADVIISTEKGIEQDPENILLVVEVKMSIVWNWELLVNGSMNKLICNGDYRSHAGTPGLLRSDSMLKAIGKSINIRVSSFKAASIPIIIMGNTPITNSYYYKVDHLKKAGIIQGFWSVNPTPLDDETVYITETDNKGFYTFKLFEEFKNSLDSLLNEDLNFFSSMKTKTELGNIIEISNKEKTYEKKAEMFLNLIRR
jgi:hypothetical protein